MEDTWRQRLADTIRTKGRAARDVSLAIGRSPGYVHGLLQEGKTPKLDNLVALCNELDISVSYLLFGVELDANAEKLMQIYSNLPTEEREAFLLRLMSSAGRGDVQRQ